MSSDRITPGASQPGLALLGAGRGAAVDAVTRAMAIALGVGTLVFVLLALGGFVAQYESFSPIWSWGIVGTVFVPPLVAAALSGVLSRRLLQGLLAIAATGHLVGLVCLVPAITTASGTLAPELGTPWLLSVSAIGTCAAAVTWRPAVAWVYLAACIVALGVDRVLASREAIAEIALQDAVYTMLFDAIFAALAIATTRAGRQLDAVADRVIHETRGSAATEAASRERSRIEALVHDSVLVALLASVRGMPHAADEARRALTQLDEMAQDSPAEPVPGSDWMWRLQSLTTEIAPAARFTHEYDDAARPIPADVAAAILEASAEAVRNSMQHAGDASRAVHARVAVEGVDVTVLDDGRGFDLAAIGPARLGVAVSILDRMRAIPGGRADIVSRPGAGTRIALAWRAA